MAYGQYSRGVTPRGGAGVTPAASNNTNEDEINGNGSGSFHNWQSLLASTSTRRRMMGRLKTAPLPQRPLFTSEFYEEEEEEADRPHGNSSSHTLTHHSHPHSHPHNSFTKHSHGDHSASTRLQLNHLNRDKFPEPQRPSFVRKHPDEPAHRMRSTHPDHGRPSPQKPTLPPPVRPYSPGHTRSISGVIRSRSGVIRSNQGENSEGSSRLSGVTRSNPSKIGEESPGLSGHIRMRSARDFKRRSPSPKNSHPDSNPFGPVRSSSTPPVTRVRENEEKPVAAKIQISDKENDHGKMTFNINGCSYTMVDRIGRGGSSEVFSVLEANGGSKLRAIKRVDLRGVSSGEAAAFRNEVQLLKRLRGERRIIELLDFEERPNELFVVMEHGEKDLASLLKEMTSTERGLTNTKTKFYWEEMLEAVAVVHKEGVVHSDLKPANFLIVSGTLKLIDFGIASAVVDDKTHVTKDNLMGTFNFMSPEAIQDLSCGGRTSADGEGKSVVKIGYKSDVWSLGCILYNMVYKKMPFGELRHPMAKFKAILDPDHKIAFPRDKSALGDHDERVVDVLERCLVRDANKRASIEQLLKHPYLRSPEAENKTNKSLGVDQLLTALSSLTPNSKRVVVENLTKTHLLTKPAYQEDL